MSPVTELDETGAEPIEVNPGSMIDTDELDRSQKREIHPFATYCEQVREKVGLPNSQAVREVVSSVCNAVARLTLVEKATIDAQSEHVAKLIAKEREEMGDRQLWVEPATRIAKCALTLRLEGNGIVAEQVAEAA